MNNERSFILVPTVGENVHDILRDFDGMGESIRTSAEACHADLRKGNRPLLEQASPYEPLATAEASPLALQAAAREAQRVGLDKIAQVVTSTDVRQRDEMSTFLASSIAPQGPSASPSPSGPSLGSRS